jgi:hypothetical protein
MSDEMNGTYNQLDPADPLKRVERMDRDSPDRERQKQEEFERRRRLAHAANPGEDRVEISPAALKALSDAELAAAAKSQAAIDAVAQPPPPQRSPS